MKKICCFIILTIQCLLSGCIRQDIEDCPSLRVRLEVKDKNYFNIDQVEAHTGLDHRVSEDLSFSSYVDRLYYALYREGETEPCLVQHLYEPLEEQAVHELLFPQELPFGEYKLVVWGNIDTEQGIEYDGKPYTYRLHGEHQEGYDVYMGSLSLTYNHAKADYVLPLERVKGKLLIEVVDMPNEVRLSYKEITHLYEEVDARWEYSGNEQVHTLEHWNYGQRHALTDTYLSPTDQHADSEVRIVFVKGTDEQSPIVQSALTKIQMKRNEITVLRYEYDVDVDIDGFNIYLLVDDHWTLIHDMDVEETR